MVSPVWCQLSPSVSKVCFSNSESIKEKMKISLGCIIYTQRACFSPCCDQHSALIIHSHMNTHKNKYTGTPKWSHTHFPISCHLICGRHDFLPYSCCGISMQYCGYPVKTTHQQEFCLHQYNRGEEVPVNCFQQKPWSTETVTTLKRLIGHRDKQLTCTLSLD